jgi:hypothetical protein
MRKDSYSRQSKSNKAKQKPRKADKAKPINTVREKAKGEKQLSIAMQNKTIR